MLISRLSFLLLHMVFSPKFMTSYCTDLHFPNFASLWQHSPLRLITPPVLHRLISNLLCTLPSCLLFLFSEVIWCIIPYPDFDCR